MPKGKLYCYRTGDGFFNDDKSIMRINEIIYARTREDKNGVLRVKKPFKIRIIVEDGK